LFEKVSEKELLDSNIDLDLTLRAADAVTDFLDKRLEKPFERFIVARLVSILYEETLDCSLGAEFESMIRSLAKQESEKSNAE
jgi:hypothetical protein